MAKMNKNNLRKLILAEMEKMMDEEVIFSKNDYYDTGMLSRHDDPGRNMYVSSCHECGSKMYEGDKVCEQCGYSMAEKDIRKEYSSLSEGNCGGCGICDPCNNDLDYVHPSYGKRTVPDITMLDPDSAYGVGFEAGSSGVFDDHGDVKIGNHKHYKGSYMAKSHLYKVSKYAEKLYHMIPDGHNLEDWMRSKLAQIADDISEVYHALDHDKFEGDL